MTSACREAGLSDPPFEERAAGFRVTIHSEWAGAPQVVDRDGAILDVLLARSSKGGLATSEIA
jgi:hypothetical protein